MDIVQRRHPKDKYTDLLRAVRRLGYTAPKSVLAQWCGISRWSITKIFAGQMSFSPPQMDKILYNLGRDRADAFLLFPPYGEKIQPSAEEAIKAAKQARELALKMLTLAGQMEVDHEHS